MVDAEGTKEPVRVTYSDGFDGLPVPSPDGTTAGVDVEPRRRQRRAAVPRAVEPREGARGARRTRRRESRARNHDETHRSRARVAASHLGLLSRSSRSSAGAAVARRPRRAVADARARRDARVRRSSKDALAGLDRRAAGGRLHRRELQRIGAKPLPGQTDFRLPFEFTAGTRDGGSTVSIAAAASAHRDVRRRERRAGAVVLRQRATSAAPVVFAGYGIVVPESAGLRLRQLRRRSTSRTRSSSCCATSPRTPTRRRAAILARYSDLRYKAMAARQRGAKAMLVVTGPRSPNAGELVPMTLRHGARRLGHRRGQHQRRRSRTRMFAGAPDKTLEAAQKALDSGNPHVAGFALPGVDRDGARRRSCARSRPATTSSPTCRRRRRSTASRSRGSRSARTTITSATATAATRSPTRTTPGKIHHGADDNASGTAAVLGDRAKRSRKQPRAPQRAGRVLVGRGARPDRLERVRRPTPPVPLDQIAAYLNFDMVGRMQDNKLTVQATGTSAGRGRSSSSRRTSPPASICSCSRIRISRPTSRRFNQAGVPCLNFFTGAHADYHKPSRHGRQDRLRGSRSRRRVRRGDRRAADGRSTEAPQFTKVEQPTQTAAAAPACACSPARFPTTRPR